MIKPTEYRDHILECLESRIKKFPNLKPEEVCSSWYYDKIFGTEMNPELVAIILKGLINEGLVVERKDSKGFPSFIPIM